jgi:hypothetical protein
MSECFCELCLRAEIVSAERPEANARIKSLPRNAAAAQMVQAADSIQALFTRNAKAYLKEVDELARAVDSWAKKCAATHTKIPFVEIWLTTSRMEEMLSLTIIHASKYTPSLWKVDRIGSAFTILLNVQDIDVSDWLCFWRYILEAWTTHKQIYLKLLQIKAKKHIGDEDLYTVALQS